MFSALPILRIDFKNRQGQDHHNVIMSSDPGFLGEIDMNQYAKILNQRLKTFGHTMTSISRFETIPVETAEVNT